MSPRPLFATLLRYLRGRKQAHEEVWWARLEQLARTGCEDPYDDAQLRRAVQSRRASARAAPPAG